MTDPLREGINYEMMRNGKEKVIMIMMQASQAAVALIPKFEQAFPQSRIGASDIAAATRLFDFLGFLV